MAQVVSPRIREAQVFPQVGLPQFEAMVAPPWATKL